MATFLNVLVGGLSIGSIYAMMAIGFSLLWQTARTINFAQGDFATVVGFVFVGLFTSLGFAVGLAAGLAVAFSVVVLGYLLRKTVIAKLLGRGVLPLVVATIALSILIQNFFVAFWTPEALSAPSLVSTRILHLDGVTVSVQNLVDLLVATLMITGLQAYLRFTKAGKALRATAQNAGTARVLGIDPGRMITLAFMLNAALVAVAAILLAPIYLVQYNIGTQLGLNAFYAAIIGGFNRVRGALVGGLVVGLLESISGAYISTAYQTGIVVAALMATLLVRPEGLLGAKELVREYQG